METPKSKNISDWYTEIIQTAELADYSAVSGCIVYRPYSYAIWEIMQRALDERFKAHGSENAYFPLLIPESLLVKEQQHVAGFTPEVAWVTQSGSTDLKERLAIRPTSETIMYYHYAKWIRSYRDLPLRINQWNSVVRWEFKHPTPFLRGREFLWQEGHSVFATEKEVKEDTRAMLDCYIDVVENYLAIPLLKGTKTDAEKFPGAVDSLAIEALMPDGKSLQMGTSHNLGQNFSKVFDIAFIDEKENEAYAWQNSWGFSTRTIGAMILAHGDDNGLVLPPKVAPIQVVIVPIFNEANRDAVVAEAKKIENKLRQFRTKLDDSDKYTPGWKSNQWEMKGVPLRIEIGPKDIEKGQVVVVRRDTGKKEAISMDALDTVGAMLDSIQASLFMKAKEFLDSHIFNAENLNDIKAALEKGGLAKMGWCGSPACEASMKESTGATIRCIPFDSKPGGSCAPHEHSSCGVCGAPAKHIVYVGRAY